MPAGARDFRKRRSKWISEGGAAGRQSHSNLGGGTNKVLGVPLLTSGNIYCTFLAGHAAALQILIFWTHSQCNILMLYSATNSRIFSLSRISKVWLVNKGRPAKSCKDGNDTHTYVYTYTYTYTYYVLRIHVYIGPAPLAVVTVRVKWWYTHMVCFGLVVIAGHGPSMLGRFLSVFFRD